MAGKLKSSPRSTAERESAARRTSERKERRVAAQTAREQRNAQLRREGKPTPREASRARYWAKWKARGSKPAERNDIGMLVRKTGDGIRLESPGDRQLVETIANRAGLNPRSLERVHRELFRGKGRR